ncbi:unnamed protein product [Euphydryas editha]|uniref:HAT C-terminal dimerisation domain-containing protein n=1 Tax=Euphydryas editha TaxID=104508 RepID=A0AAU9VFJ3_EUPED|nr:unnamed protein product [Euphydryas editha]
MTSSQLITDVSEYESRSRRDKGELDEESLNIFYTKCKEFYIEAAKQMKKRFPFNDTDRQALKCLKMLDPKAIIDPEAKHNIRSIADMLHFFPNICPDNVTELDREWRMLRHTNLPIENEIPEVFQYWKHISELKNGDGSQRFPILCDMVKNFLCLPHSSAAVERLFSAVNILKSKLRNKMSSTTIKGILHTKSEINECYAFDATENHRKILIKGCTILTKTMKQKILRIE